MSSPAPAESSRRASSRADVRGSLHAGNSGDGTNGTVEPHTAGGAGDDSEGEHVKQRVLAVKLDLREEELKYKRLKELSWQAARYRNLDIRGRWSEAYGLCVDPNKQVPHDVTKKIRDVEKMELSGAAYSAAEREVTGAWKRLGKRIMAGAPLPEWKPTAALSIRGHQNKRESGVWLETDADGRFVAYLQAESETCIKAGKALSQQYSGRYAIAVPIAAGTEKDFQAEMLQKMVTWEVPISKATVVIRPMRHDAILRLSYALTIPLPAFGNRVATLSPSHDGRLLLRTECDTRDFSSNLQRLLKRKTDWDLIRRRAAAQIGRKKGGARAKRLFFARTSWDGWLFDFLHKWTHEIIKWLHGQGICELKVIGLERWDWPVYQFTQRLREKGEKVGIQVKTEADLADASTERAVKAEIGKRRRKATRTGKAARELMAVGSGKS